MGGGVGARGTRGNPKVWGGVWGGTEGTRSHSGSDMTPLHTQDLINIPLEHRWSANPQPVTPGITCNIRVLTASSPGLSPSMTPSQLS